MSVKAITLLKHVKTLDQLFKLLDDGDFSSSLGDIEMSAAREAFAAVPRSTDRRGQIWRCIGHLGTAQHAYEHFIRNRSLPIETFARMEREDDANVKRRFALVLKAICYKYLGEECLCTEALAASKVTIKADMSKAQLAATNVYALFSAGSAFMFLEKAYGRAVGIGNAREQYEVDDKTFSRLSELLK